MCGDGGVVPAVAATQRHADDVDPVSDAGCGFHDLLENVLHRSRVEQGSGERGELTAKGPQWKSVIPSRGNPVAIGSFDISDEPLSVAIPTG